ncbi:hypothetical protein [Salinicoccus roseus]|uniref:hypothetical protein n=1 Tax=Salinicoccus roseus TaxID=45670 RepID=UPI003D9FD818
MAYLTKYFLTITIFITLLILSPLTTEVYTNGTIKYFLMVLILTTTNLFVEYFANKKYSDYQQRIKNTSGYLLPLNWLVAIVFIFFLI